MSEANVNANELSLSITIDAESTGQEIQTVLGGDYYYAELAKEWATKTNGKVLSEDYSAKYYAQEAKKSVSEELKKIENVKNEALSNIQEKEFEAIENIEAQTKDIVDVSINSATTALENSNLAKQWATSEIIVEDTDYSAKYYAEKAKINSGIFYDELTEEDIDVDIISGDYVTRTELENGLATKQDVGTYLTQETDPIYTADKPTLALKSELPDTSNFVTNDDFQGQLNTKQPKGDYALKSELPNLTNYATKTELDAKQNRLAATGTNRIPVYCDGYILKPVVALSAELVSGGFTKEVYYAHHPEMSEMHILPFIYNDFAFIDKKGGSYTITRNDNGEIGNPHNVFDAAPSFMHSRGFTEDTLWTVDIATPKTFTYGTLLYIDFGTPGFACSYAKIEAQHSVTGEWKTILEKADNTASYIYCRCNSDDLGVNKFKFTFKKPLNTQQFRISAIGAISYKSAGVEETMLTLKGGTVYGDVIAPNITKMQDEINNLKTTIANLQVALSELK